jgi:hypothetical protein
MPPASHQVSATSLKLLIQQIHPHVRVERDTGMCVARDLYELWGRYSAKTLLSWGALAYMAAKIAEYFPISAEYQLPIKVAKKTDVVLATIFCFFRTKIEILKVV